MNTSNVVCSSRLAIFPAPAAGLLAVAGPLMPTGLDQPIRRLDEARA